MKYSVTVSSTFKASPSDIYKALCFLDDYPIWNTGMVSISKSGYIKENMLVQSESIVVGHHVLSNFEVVRLIEDKEIELINNSGAITYRAIYQLLSETDNETEVVCMLQFELRGFALNLARPIIETMAESRLRGNLESLQALMQA